MDIFTNLPLTGYRGRPRSPVCKRGHERIAGEKSCVACRRHRERVKYATNELFAGKKKAYQSQYRADFFAEQGYGVHCSLAMSLDKSGGAT